MPVEKARNHFSAFTIKYKGPTNRITTDVALSEAFDPADPPDPLPPVHGTTALWDTGATNSVITSTAVRALNLQSVGSGLTTHAGGQEETERYLVNFLLPNRVGAVGVLVSECKHIVDDFGAIIGMDIISQSDLAITNANGQTCMSFRIPSIETVDYVIEANRIKYAGVRPNDPCPCGRSDQNGKPIKFKHCCRKELR